MTPNITDITVPARACLDAGLDGVSAINTIACVMGVDLDSLRPIPTVEGRSTPGGYSGRAVKPVALAKVAAVAGAIERDAGYKARGASLSGIGGVETGADAAEFLLLGAGTVQVCTGVMLHGYPLVQRLCGGLQRFMEAKGFGSIDEFKGMALPYVTTHSELVARQRGPKKDERGQLAAVAAAATKAAPAAAGGGGGGRVGLASDAEWTGDNFVADADSMVANK
jgi:dihydropyrimidine dehydrogenase (NADP+)